MKCAKAACNGEPLKEIELENTWTVKKYICPKCDHVYVVSTKIGKVSQVAPIVTGTAIVASILNGIFGDGHHSDDISA
ncbi:hypothetical protein ACO2Q8_29160 [Larkinella sp. VNQ87]|uniref:hypothetical protein n=1 Tax=Larkinella sp. VNQ87 TaxID=3400921 RepID=UPI003BFF1201